MIWFPGTKSALGEQLEMGGRPDAFTQMQQDHGEKTPIRALKETRPAPKSCVMTLRPWASHCDILCYLIQLVCETLIVIIQLRKTR